jgi:DNA gyrase subunit A
VGVRLNLTAEDIMLGTRDGKAIHFKDGEVRQMGRATHGVRGLKLVGDDEVVDIVTAGPNATLLTSCEHGYGKRTVFDEYPVQGRGGQGVIGIKTEGRNGKVVALRDVHDNEDVMMITSSGMVIRTAVRDISLIGRNTQGVRLIRLEENDRLVSVAPVAEEEGGEGEGEGAEGEVVEEPEAEEAAEETGEAGAQGEAKEV